MKTKVVQQDPWMSHVTLTRARDARDVNDTHDTRDSFDSCEHSDILIPWSQLLRIQSIRVYTLYALLEI